MTKGNVRVIIYISRSCLGILLCILWKSL